MIANGEQKVQPLSLFSQLSQDLCLTCFTQTCQLCVSTIVKMFFMKNISLCGCCSLLIFVAKKAGKDTELQLLSTQGTLQGGRVEDHRLMFIRHLHSPQ